MTYTTSCVDWQDFIPMKYNEFIADIWSWLDEASELPPIYAIWKVNTKYCEFNPKLRYQKMFWGHKFKIGGHKE